MNIRSLLNPYELDSHYGYRSTESHHSYRSSASPTPAILPRSVARDTHTSKRTKIPKDAPIFTGAKVNGPVNFPPYEFVRDEELRKQHCKFQVHPLGDIQRNGARRIPYNSDKKDFMTKTGRDAFEVFQYEFKKPGTDKSYYVYWDYQIGLVRITPFFKCLNFSKTTPAKVLNLNPGLRDICYSITGGALAAQGYWMPYKCAKSVCATFCYKIRHALTPLFGEDFLHMCTHPDDPAYAKFLIDPAIVRECTEETNRWRTEGLSYKPYQPGPSAAPSSNANTSNPTTPRMKFASPPWGAKASKASSSLLYATSKQKHQDQESGYGSGYGTDACETASERYMCSPEVSPRSHGWTPINGSPAPSFVPVWSPTQRCYTSAPGSGRDVQQYREKRAASTVAYTEVEEEEGVQTPRQVVVYGREEEERRPSTRGTVAYATNAHTMGWEDYRARYPHLTEEDFEAAETLLLLSQSGERQKEYRIKRTRRGSRY